MVGRQTLVFGIKRMHSKEAGFLKWHENKCILVKISFNLSLIIHSSICDVSPFYLRSNQRSNFQSEFENSWTDSPITEISKSNDQIPDEPWMPNLLDSPARSPRNLLDISEAETGFDQSIRANQRERFVPGSKIEPFEIAMKSGKVERKATLVSNIEAQTSNILVTSESLASTNTITTTTASSQRSIALNDVFEV